MTMILESVITCPHCATAKSETMPTDACRFFYECTGCGARLRPKEGDCCVFLLLRLGALSADAARTLRRAGRSFVPCGISDGQRQYPTLARLAGQQGQLAPLRHHEVIRLCPLTRVKRSCVDIAGRPSLTPSGHWRAKSPSAAGSDLILGS
jgi:hypothetical protein